MKKLVALILVLMMVMSFAVTSTALAAGKGHGHGKGSYGVQQRHKDSYCLQQDCPYYPDCPRDGSCCLVSTGSAGSGCGRHHGC
jgi:hypothetical protein